MENKSYVLDCCDVKKDYCSFKSECGCFAHDLQVQVFKECDIPQLVLSDQVYIGEINENLPLIKRIWFRIKNAWKCLFGDGFDIEYGFCFKGEQHVKQFVDHINNSCQEIFTEDNKQASSSTKHYYKLPFLPWGWSIYNLSVQLLDYTSYNDKDEKLKIIDIKLKDDGNGHYVAITNINDDNNKIKMDFEASVLPELGYFIRGLTDITDHSIKKADKETHVDLIYDGEYQTSDEKEFTTTEE